MRHDMCTLSHIHAVRILIHAAQTSHTCIRTYRRSYVHTGHTHPHTCIHTYLRTRYLHAPLHVMVLKDTHVYVFISQSPLYEFISLSPPPPSLRPSLSLHPAGLCAHTKIPAFLYVNIYNHTHTHTHTHTRAHTHSHSHTGLGT
jgi:hypothetical protein